MTDQGPNREEAKQGEEAKQEGGGGPLDQVQDTVGGVTKGVPVVGEPAGQVQDQVQDTVGGVTKDLPIVGGGGDDEEEGGGLGGGLL